MGQELESKYLKNSQTIFNLFFNIQIQHFLFVTSKQHYA